MNDNIENLDTARTIRSVMRGIRFIDGLAFKSSCWMNDRGKYVIRYEAEVNEEAVRMGRVAVKPPRTGFFAGLARFLVWFFIAYAMIMVARWAF